MEELAKTLRALLRLSIWSVQREAERAGVPTPRMELLLSESGYSTKEIAELLGKTPVAVAKAISRGRAGNRKNVGTADTSTEETLDV